MTDPTTPKYVIRWRSTVNGTRGQGTLAMEREDADVLCHELNENYENIVHEVVLEGEPEV